jgi:hypothetical protein
VHSHPFQLTPSQTHHSCTAHNLYTLLFNKQQLTVDHCGTSSKPSGEPQALHNTPDHEQAPLARPLNHESSYLQDSQSNRPALSSRMMHSKPFIKDYMPAEHCNAWQHDASGPEAVACDQDQLQAHKSLSMDTTPSAQMNVYYSNPWI